MEILFGIIVMLIFVKWASRVIANKLNKFKDLITQKY